VDVLILENLSANSMHYSNYFIIRLNITINLLSNIKLEIPLLQYKSRQQKLLI